VLTRTAPSDMPFPGGPAPRSDLPRIDAAVAVMRSRPGSPSPSGSGTCRAGRGCCRYEHYVRRSADDRERTYGLSPRRCRNAAYARYGTYGLSRRLTQPEFWGTCYGALSGDARPGSLLSSRIPTPPSSSPGSWSCDAIEIPLGRSSIIHPATVRME
jgi:hypothetical protein